LDNSQFSRLQAFMKDSLSQKLPGYENMKPIFTSQHISTNYCIEGKQQSYELYFNRTFKQQDKPVSGLEKASEQMAFLDKIPIEEQITALMETLEDPSKTCDQYAKMVHHYREQRLDKLLNLSEEEEMVEEFTDVLLVNRNKDWIPKLEKMLASDRLFIAVGAGHLPGPKGVIALLRARGFTVRPLL
ncbi:MAG: TraB/GumN family protein, partial [Bacteroidota bacterium]